RRQDELRNLIRVLDPQQAKLAPLVIAQQPHLPRQVVPLLRLELGQVLLEGGRQRDRVERPQAARDVNEKAFSQPSRALDVPPAEAVRRYAVQINGIVPR